MENITMENTLGAIAFFALIAGQFAAVIAVSRMRLEGEVAEQPESRPEIKVDAQTKHTWLSAA